MTSTLHQNYSGDQIKKNEMGGVGDMMAEKKCIHSRGPR